MAKKTTLKTRQGEILYPQTKADIVYLNDDTNVESVINTLSTDVNEMKDKVKHDLGWYPTLQALKTAHPTGTNGDFAIVGEDDKLYTWDSDTNQWKDTGTSQYIGIHSINGKTGNEVTLTTNDIEGTVDGKTQSITEHLTDIVGNIGDVEDEIEGLQNKPTVLFLTSSDFTSATSLETYNNGQLAICTSDDSETYKLGTTYKYVISGETYSWEEFSTSGSSGIPLLEGTEDTPVILDTLEDGWYVISGWFKTHQGSQYVIRHIYRDYFDGSDWTKIDDKMLYRCNKNYDEAYTYFDIYALNTGNDFAISDTGRYVCYGSFGVATELGWSAINVDVSNYVQSYNGSRGNNALTTSNTTQYVPLERYNPATKDYVDNNINDVKPIDTYDDPTSESEIKLNKFGTSQEWTDTRLFAYKQTNESEDYIKLPTNGNKYSKVYINKSAVEQTYTEFGTGGGGWCYLGVWLQPDSGDEYKWADALINCSYENGEITTLSCGYLDTIYDKTNGWVTYGQEEAPEGYFDLLNALRSKTGLTQISNGSFVNFGWETLYNAIDLVDVLTVQPVITPLRIAQYDDTNNVNDIKAFFEDHSEFVDSEGNPMYMNWVVGQSITDATVQAYLQNLFTYLTSFSNTDAFYYPYSANMWAVVGDTQGNLQDPTTMYLTYTLNEQGTYYKITYDSSTGTFVKSDLQWLTTKPKENVKLTSNTYLSNLAVGKYDIEDTSILLYYTSSSSINVKNGTVEITKSGSYTYYTYNGQYYISNTWRKATITGRVNISQKSIQLYGEFAGIVPVFQGSMPQSDSSDATYYLMGSRNNTSSSSYYGSTKASDVHIIESGKYLKQSGKYFPTMNSTTTTANKIFASTGSFLEGDWKDLLTLLGVSSIVTLTQAEYDALETKDTNTIYLIKE